MRLSRWLPVLIGLLLAAAACGPVVVDVELGLYQALVPSAEQIEIDVGQNLPGGFSALRDAGVDLVELRVDGDQASFLLDGVDTATRQVIERLQIQDSEGSGPFKAEKEVLILGGGPLTLAGLTITDPVIWPGSFDGSPVVTVKQRNADERGPGVSCGPDESCLLLTAGVDALGGYEDVNNPALDQNPIATIEVTDAGVEFILDSGETVRSGTASQSVTRGCGLSETATWEVPAAAGLALEDPVAIHTLCPTNPGASIQMVIMERSAIPVLAPLGPTTTDGEWCSASSDCLWFAPTEP